MRIAPIVSMALLLGAAAAPAQQAPVAAPGPAPRTHGFGLHLEPLYQLGYEPARELRLALWDSPMSRLELAAAREQWSVRNPGPTGTVIPFEGVQLPLRLSMVSTSQKLVLGPWSPGWNDLTWQEKTAAYAQTGVLAAGIIEILSHLH
jgi:hypothetical protein